LDKHIHIVTLDVPWPADYGGVVDLFYKLKALYRLGVKIHLHCFTKDRAPQPELAQYCVSVHYYQRRSALQSFSLKTPFIVQSRTSKALIDNLQKDNYPVLLEGIHCTLYLYNGALQNRRVLVRLHNAEFAYYAQLAKQERNPLRKIFFWFESKKLFRYEKQLAAKAVFAAVSRHDVDVYKKMFNARQVYYLPVFVPYTMAAGKPGNGLYCLYHGNLSVNENEAAATWLLENVFAQLKIPLVIAGKNPSDKLQHLAHEHQHTCIVANPGEAEMQDMIAKAQLHVLPSFNNTGIKLKLINAVFNGRHCLVNKQAATGSDLEDACYFAEDAVSFAKQVEVLYKQNFTEQETEKRQGLLQNIFNNNANSEKLLTWL
jgi:glycosyltransferase involved in cell wall biosynthesis